MPVDLMQLLKKMSPERARSFPTALHWKQRAKEMEKGKPDQWAIEFGHSWALVDGAKGTGPEDSP